MFPIAYGHVLFVLSGIQPFFDTDGLEIGFPQLLEGLFIFVHQAFIEYAGYQMALRGIVEGNFLYGL
jgi:hypothetical protein